MIIFIIINRFNLESHNLNSLIFLILIFMGFGYWGLGIGYWGLGPIPNPQSQSPIPNPQSPIPNPHFYQLAKL